MTTPDWTTAGLPQCFLFGSAKERRRAFWANDPAEVGAGRRRRRFSRTLRLWPEVSTPPISQAEVEALEAFFDETTDGGALSFTFPRPRRVSVDQSVTIVTVKFISEIEIIPRTAGKYLGQFGVEEV